MISVTIFPAYPGQKALSEKKRMLKDTIHNAEYKLQTVYATKK